MRTAILLGLSLCSLSRAQAAEAESNFSCIEQIQIPRYPRLALFARVTGDVETRIRLSPQAAIEKIASSGHPLLVSGVETTMRAAKFRAECAGKTITLIFEFKFSGIESFEPRETVFLNYPNRFVIVSELQKGPVI